MARTIEVSPDFRVTVWAPGPRFANSAAAFGVVPLLCATAENAEKCVVPPGARLAVSVALDSLRDSPDENGNTLNGFPAYGVALHYSPGLTEHVTANEREPLPAGHPVS